MLANYLSGDLMFEDIFYEIKIQISIFIAVEANALESGDLVKKLRKLLPQWGPVSGTCTISPFPARQLKIFHN
jgi:hypothetical protein